MTSVSGGAGNIPCQKLKRVIQDFTGSQRTASTLRGHLQSVAQVAHRAAALFDRFTNVSISNRPAYTDIHDSKPIP